MLEARHWADHRLAIILLIIGEGPSAILVNMALIIGKRNHRLVSAMGGAGWGRQLSFRELASLL